MPEATAYQENMPDMHDRCSMTSYGHPELLPKFRSLPGIAGQVIGADDVHRDQVMMLEGQLSELMDKCGWCCLPQNLIHLSMQSLSHPHDITTHKVEPDTWGKAQADHESAAQCVWYAYSNDNA